MVRSTEIRKSSVLPRDGGISLYIILETQKAEERVRAKVMAQQLRLLADWLGIRVTPPRGFECLVTGE